MLILDTGTLVDPMAKFVCSRDKQNNHIPDLQFIMLDDKAKAKKGNN